MSRFPRMHVRLYGLFLRLMPADHRSRHRRDQLQLFADCLAAGHRPSTLWGRAVPDLIGVMRATGPRLVVGHLAQLALGPLSVLNLAGGSALATIAVLTSAVPAWVVVPAAAVAVQGGSGLVRSRPSGARSRLAGRLFVVGESVAVAVAATGIVAATVRQYDESDPEYGPPTIMALVVAHGVAALVATLADPDRSSPAAST